MHWHIRTCTVLHAANSLITSPFLLFSHSSTETLASLLIPKQDSMHTPVHWAFIYLKQFYEMDAWLLPSPSSVLCIYSTSLMRFTLMILFTILIYSPISIPLTCPSLFSPYDLSPFSILLNTLLELRSVNLFLFVFTNKILLEYNHAHTIIYYLGLLL